MLFYKIKCSLVLLLAIIMVFSLIPGSVLAAEDTNVHSVEGKTAVKKPTVAPTAESTIIIADHPVLVGYQNEMNRILSEYLETSNLSPEQAAQGAAALDEWNTYDAYWDVLIVEDDLMMDYDAGALSEAEINALLDAEAAFLAFAEVVYANAPADDASVYASPVNVLDGQVTISSSDASSLSESNGTVTATATGGLLSKATATITVTNTSGSPAEVSFNYSASKYNSFNEASASGTKTLTMKSGDTYTFTIKSNSGFNNTTATLTLSDFSITVATGNSNFKVNYNSTLGSVTYNGAAMSSGDTVSVPATGGAFVATPASGMSFLGWINAADNTMYASGASANLSDMNDIELIAAFSGANAPAWFIVGDRYYNDLNAAATYASNASNKTVVLAATGTLPAGDYTIPSSVTLLIPRSADHKLYTTLPNQQAPEGFNDVPVVTEFRTLYMATGANIAVNGAISVAGTQNAGGGYPGSFGHKTDGAAGFIRMQTNSNIVLNNGASLYAWGVIMGSGTVEAMGGAMVYEMFQISNFYGAELVKEMAENKDKAVFPVSQYYVQNIEVPLKMHAGSFEYCPFSINVAIIGVQKTTVDFIGNGSAFLNLSSGYLIKDYIENQDRLEIKIYGDAEVKAVKLNLKFGLLESAINIDSSTHVLNINHNMTLQVCSGTTNVSQSLALMPSSKVIIDEGAKVVLGSGKALYLYDQDQKRSKLTVAGDSGYAVGTEGGYVGVYHSHTITPVSVAPGRTATRATDGSGLVDAELIINGTLDVSAGTGLYVTAGGAKIYSTGTTGELIFVKGSQSVAYQGQHYYKNSDHALDYPPFDLYMPKLNNADGTQLDTVLSTDINSFNYTSGKWICKTHIGVTTDHTCDVCGFVTACVDIDPADHSCDICGDTIHTDKDGNLACDFCSKPLARLAAIDVSADAETELRLKFYIHESLVKDAEGNDLDTKVTVLFNSYPSSTTEELYLKDLTTDANGRYVLTQDVASGEMRRDMTVTFTDVDGEAITIIETDGTNVTQISRSVLDYAELVLAKGDERQKAVITSMLTYGGYAQKYFGVDASDPVYGLLGDSAPVLSDPTITDTPALGSYEGITFKTWNAYLDTAVYMRWFFILAEGHSIDDYTFTLTYAYKNEDHTKSITPGYDSANNRYYLEIADIPAAYIGYTYRVEISLKDSNTSYTASASVADFLNAILKTADATEEKKALAKAMYQYGEAAQAFFFPTAG